MITRKGERLLVVISDFQDGLPQASAAPPPEEFLRRWGSLGEKPRHIGGDADNVIVAGSYVERMPLACLKSGLIDRIEVWSHWRSERPPPPDVTNEPHLIRRFFQMNGPQAPFASNHMLAHIIKFGSPAVLCVWGLGVCEDILTACKDSYKIYNSIDAPTWRIPVEVSRHFQLVLTGAQWQSEEVTLRHPEMDTLILPIGPEFASQSMFYPLGGPKPYDVVYVASAQAYKRHDILFEALATLPRSVRAMCVFGYGELGPTLRSKARELEISVDFVGPPGVSYAEVNRLMNLAKIGVVCGVDDGAPAILTEYMLAGLPVLANAALRCGLQYITPKTGRAASAEIFGEAIVEMLSTLSAFSPREAVIRNWIWPHSVRKLDGLINT